MDTTRGVFQGNSASGNGINGIRVYSYLEGPATWEDALPFVVDPWIDVYTGATLTVKPGVVVKIAPSGVNKIQVEGTLHAGQSGQARVYVRSLRDDGVGGDTNGDGTATSPARGDWGGIGFSGGAVNNTLANVEVRYAGALDWYPPNSFYGAVFTQSPSLAISDSTIADSSSSGFFGHVGSFSLTNSRIERTDGYSIVFAASGSLSGAVSNCPYLEGVYYLGAGPRITWTGNTFNNWGQKTSRVAPDDLGSLTNANTFNGVAGALLEVWSGYVTSDATWSKAAGPLSILGNVVVQGTDGADRGRHCGSIRGSRCASPRAPGCTSATAAPCPGS